MKIVSSSSHPFVPYSEPTSRDIPTLLHIRAKLTSCAMKWVVMERRVVAFKLSTSVATLNESNISDEIVATWRLGDTDFLS